MGFGSTRWFCLSSRFRNDGLLESHYIQNFCKFGITKPHKTPISERCIFPCPDDLFADLKIAARFLTTSAKLVYSAIRQRFRSPQFSLGLAKISPSPVRSLIRTLDPPRHSLAIDAIQQNAMRRFKTL